MLPDAPLQMAVAALAGTVFLRSSHIDRARCKAIVLTNRKILRVEHARAATPLQLVGRRRGMIRQQLPRHPAQAAQRRLQPGPQRQRGLTVSAHRPLPVRIRQHRVEQLVGQWPALDRDPQAAHIRPIHRQHCARRMILGEKHLLLRSLRQPPLAHPALKRP